MMRSWLVAMLAALFPGAAGQDMPKGPTPPSSAPAHAICGGDALAPKVPTILVGYGKGGFAVTTANPQAQAFFDNGMQLAHAFAHKAAVAAMHHAGGLDPACAMCAWGEAWADGPTINYGKDKGEVAKLAVLAGKADALARAHGTDRERALTAALELRYHDGGGDKPGDLAFAKAMDALVTRYPEDDEIATIAADAWLMVKWKSRNDRATVWHSIALLEPVLRRDPDYTPAIHFYIHATEIAEVPGRAERYADRLQRLAPAASHLVHMPSHTYYQIGRYQDAADANVRAVAIGVENAKRLGLAGPDGVWGLPYHAHNVHYGLGGAMMSGDAKDALDLARPLTRVAAIRGKGDAFSQMIAGMGYAAMGRYAPAAEVAALPEPKLPYLKAYWHYARGEAAARAGDAAAVLREAAAIPTRFAAAKGDDGDRAAAEMAAIARAVLQGRAAMLAGQPKVALARYAAAAKLEESRTFADYGDPPLWWYPVRRSMAEARLAGGDAAGALREADASLKRRPSDPTTLAVRARAEAVLGGVRAAERDRAQAVAGWRGPWSLLGEALG